MLWIQPAAALLVVAAEAEVNLLPPNAGGLYFEYSPPFVLLWMTAEQA